MTLTDGACAFTTLLALTAAPSPVKASPCIDDMDRFAIACGDGGCEVIAHNTWDWMPDHCLALPERGVVTPALSERVLADFRSEVPEPASGAYLVRYSVAQDPLGAGPIDDSEWPPISEVEGPSPDSAELVSQLDESAAFGRIARAVVYVIWLALLVAALALAVAPIREAKRLVRDDDTETPPRAWHGSLLLGAAALLGLLTGVLSCPPIWVLWCAVFIPAAIIGTVGRYVVRFGS